MKSIYLDPRMIEELNIIRQYSSPFVPTFSAMVTEYCNQGILNFYKLHKGVTHAEDLYQDKAVSEQKA
jgi:hypothetical protein